MRQRILLTAIAVLVILSFASPSRAGNDVGVTLPPGPDEPPTRSVSTSSCPNYQKTGVYTQVGGGSTTAASYGYFEYTCDGKTWIRVWGCIANCPAGVTPLSNPPDPGWIEAELAKSAPNPDGTFAPPVHRDNIAAITGLRLYAHISTDTYHVVDAPEITTGPWHASAIETPGQITLDVDGVSITCATNPPDPSTKEGRSKSECYLPITTVPDSGLAHVTLTVTWHINVTTNVPGVTPNYTINKATELDIRVKELQAVVET